MLLEQNYMKHVTHMFIILFCIFQVPVTISNYYSESFITNLLPHMCAIT